MFVRAYVATIDWKKKRPLIIINHNLVQTISKFNKPNNVTC